jgi:hypothetical protein
MKSAIVGIIALAFTARLASEPPPYPLFSAPTKKFEPSAAAYDPASGWVVVLNDKDSMVHAYRWQDGKLEAATAKPPELDAGGAIRKFEAMARIPETRSKSFSGVPFSEFLAVTAFDRDDPAFRRIVRFRYPGDPHQKIAAANVEILQSALEDSVKRTTGQRWFKIEGVAFDKSGKQVYLGLRNVGPDYKHPRDVVLLLRCPFFGDKIGPPNAVFQFSTKAAIGADEGLSDFVRDPTTGDYWLLTSKELGSKYVTDHGGHLFRFPAVWLDGEAAATPKFLDKPISEFKGKCEALVPLPGGRKLILFDSDDEGWKKHFDGFTPEKAMYLFLP